MFLNINQIRRKRSRRLDETKVRGIMRSLEEEFWLPPIRVSKQDNGYRIVGDGRHRLEAHVRLGMQVIEVEEV